MEVASLGSPVAIAVAASLLLGKPIGIVLLSWIATRLGFARLPAEVNWKIGTLVGSTISAILGCSLLLMFMPKRSEATVGVQKQQPGGKEMPGLHLSEVNEQTQSDRWRDDGGQGGFDKE